MESEDLYLFRGKRGTHLHWKESTLQSLYLPDEKYCSKRRHFWNSYLRDGVGVVASMSWPNSKLGK